MLRKFPLFFILMVILPTVAAIYYYFYKATPQYVAETQFIVQGYSMPKLDVLGALTGIPSIGGGSSDVMVVKSYLQSADFIKDIQKDVDLRKLFSNPNIDFYARLKPDASQEELIEYWKNMVNVELDQLSGITTISMTSFDRNTSRELVTLALNRSEKLINHMSNRLRNDSLEQAEKEVKAAESNVMETRNRLTEFNKKYDVINPAKQEGERITQEESTRLQLVAKLQGQLAEAESELAQLSSFMQPEALKVKNAQSRVNSLRQQIAKEQIVTKRETSGKSAQAAPILAKHAELQAQQTMAEQFYQGKLATLEQIRIDHDRQQRYLTVIVQPNLPDEALRPDRINGVLTVLLLSFLTWGIGSLSIAAIKDHAGWV